MCTEGVRVLIVDSDRWRELGLCKAIESAAGLTPIRGSELGERTWSRFDAPAVVLLSESSARNDPRRSLGRIRTKFPDARILLVGDSAEPGEVAEMVTDGAHGYFSLRHGEEKLIQAIKVVGRGGFWTSEKAIAALINRVHRSPDRPAGALTDAERSLLRMLDEGMTNKEMAQRLGVAEITVKTRLASLFRRFGVRSRVQLLSYAIRKKLLKHS